MSEDPDFGSWLVCDGDRTDASINLVSTSSSSRSQSSLNLHQIGNAHGTDDVNTISPNAEATPISKSCDDLLQDTQEKDSTFPRSRSCNSLGSNQSLGRGKYDHVQSKIKQYIQVLNEPSPREKSKLQAPAKINPSETSKEEYLEEINHRLSRELDEKNAVLLQLQENYEHLLLKYAEAQNKIDNLRLKTINPSEQPSRNQNETNSFRMNISAPPIYPFKIAETAEAKRLKFIKNEMHVDGETKIDRPTTLAVEPGLKLNEKDGLKAVTPTDSEGVSSVITSMSGHSKILNNFDDNRLEAENEKPILKSEVLENTLTVNDPIDKVKNWQNSLPPLEFIETPDTALYDMEPVTTPSTRYNEISELGKIPESSETWSVTNSKTVSQALMKKYLRTLSLPSSLTRRNMLAQIYKRRNNHTIDLSTPLHVDCISPRTENASTTEATSPKNQDVPPANIIQRRKKRPPFLRSASLPIYDCDSPRSGSRNVPPLDLDNLTFSEDDSSPVSKSNMITTPSFLTSHDYSFQTFNSLNSCKATVSDYSGSSPSRSAKPVSIHKSTSITPDRSKHMIFFESPEAIPVVENVCCNICGESVISMKAASYQGIHVKSQEWSSSLRSKTSVHRSLSFNSESSSPIHCLHNKVSCEHDPVESFDVYARDLKSKSQMIMKALTAHVRNT